MSGLIKERLTKRRERTGDADGREEGVSIAIVAGGDGTPILQSAEHIFKASLIRIYVVGQLDSAVAQRRSARFHPALSQFLPKPVDVISFVSQ
ncbi:MAG: hypothetical protein LBI47_02850 [Puniceicoccales bacterium]|nr:hypothetical protein [Puniceicoccales bacterium]